MSRSISLDALLLEDFDIKNMKEWFPKRKIGVSVSQIYIQIAKFSGNPKRKKELIILSKAISDFGIQEYEIEPRYVLMEVKDAEQCFKKNLKKLPKKTFIKIDEINEQSIRG